MIFPHNNNNNVSDEEKKKDLFVIKEGIKKNNQAIMVESCDTKTKERNMK